MTAGRTYIGIDGCRAGWFCVILDGEGHGSWRLATDARVLGELAATAECALIDIPIGLLDSGPEGRRCDREARRRLGRGRAASVFAAPARPTLAAADYADALRRNRAATGRGLSRQAWNLVPKIREVDALLREQPALRGVLRESHPELCFQALHGGRAMRHNKKQPAGRWERLAVLSRHLPSCRTLFDAALDALPRRAVAADDILDAMACVLVARSGYGHYQTLPSQPPRDGQGLAMEIVCCATVSRSREPRAGG